MNRPNRKLGLNWKDYAAVRAYRNEWQRAKRHQGNFRIPIGDRYKQIVAVLLERPSA